MFLFTKYQLDQTNVKNNKKNYYSIEKIKKRNIESFIITIINGKKIVIATTTASGITGAFGGILTCAGFTSSGIAAGSAAAASQAAVGNIAAGTTFATLQSLGVSGVFYGLGVAGGVGVVAGGVYGGVKLYQYYKNKKIQPKL